MTFTHRVLITSGILTVILWFVIILILFLLPPVQNKEKFVTVKLQLSEKVTEKELEKPVIKQVEEHFEEIIDEQLYQPLSKDIQQPQIVEQEKNNVKNEPINTVPLPIEPPKQKAVNKKPVPVQQESVKQAPKVVTEKPKVTPSKIDPILEVKPQQLVKSVEELMEEQNKKRSVKKTEDVDWDSMFSDQSIVTKSETSISEKVEKSANTQISPNKIESLSGKAGAKAKVDEGTIVKSEGRASIDQRTNPENSHIDSSITDKLVQITNSFLTESEFDDETSSQIDINTVESISDEVVDGETISILMKDGKSRRLLSPSRPVIHISEKNAHLIESTIKNIQISFTVYKDGTVPSSKVNITPESLLHAEVVAEIRSQIAFWRFETSESNGQASFTYSIIKR